METGALGIVGALRQSGEIEAVAGRDRLVVGDDCIAAEGGALDLLAIDQVFHAQREIRMAADADVLADDKVGVKPALRFQHRVAGSFLDPFGGTRIEFVGPVDVTGQQRIDARRFVGNAKQKHFVEVGQAWFPVVRIAHPDGAHAGRELLAAKCSGADRAGEAGGAVLDDHERRGGQDHRQVGIGPLEANLERQRAGRPDRFELLGQRPDLGAERRIVVAVERIGHVGRGQRFTIVKLYALAQLDVPQRRILGAEFFGQHHLRRQLGVERGQAVIEHVGADVVGRQRTLGRVERVGARARLSGRRQAPATARLRSGGAGIGQRNAGARDQAAGNQGAQQLAARHAIAR